MPSLRAEEDCRLADSKNKQRQSWVELLRLWARMTALGGTSFQSKIRLRVWLDVFGLGLCGLLAMLPPALGAQTVLREPAAVRIEVMSLFHPRRLLISAMLETLTFTLADSRLVALNRGETAGLDVSEGGVLVTMPGAPPVLTRSVSVAPARFTLEVSGKLTRAYTGALAVWPKGRELVAVVAMAPEVAVASIVAAESMPGTPAEALRAQAVASRSYLLANLRRHGRGAGQVGGALDLDSCDTTHCQFLRSPPPPGSPADRATRATAGEVLVWTPAAGAAPRLVSAMFSRSCGGETRAWPNPADSGAYPFYRVVCLACRKRGLPRAGNGAGLCQFGAVDLAGRGRTYAQILAYFFPNTFLISVR